MNSANGKIVEFDSAESGNGAPAAAVFKIFNRIVDWITNDRMQLINVTDRINEVVRKSGVRMASFTCSRCTRLRRYSSTSGRTRCCTMYANFWTIW